MVAKIAPDEIAGRNCEPGLVDYREETKKLIETEVRNQLTDEIRKASQAILAENRKAIQQLVEESRLIIREIVEEEKGTIRKRLEDLRSAVLKVGL